jgi:uncharacterized protein YndB with AHSA1/START domain
MANDFLTATARSRAQIARVIERSNQFAAENQPVTAHHKIEAGTQDLLFTRVFDAPVDRVWRAWTESELVMHWWGPTGFSCPAARMDVREGGASLVGMRPPKQFGRQDMFNTWTYTRVVPNERLEYTLHFADKEGRRIDPATLNLPAEMPQEVRHTLVLRSLGEARTEITLTEHDWPMGQMRELSKQGMEQCLDKMAALLRAP